VEISYPFAADYFENLTFPDFLGIDLVLAFLISPASLNVEGGNAASI